MTGIEAEEVIINYEWALNWPLFPEGVLGDFWDAFFHALDVVTFARQPEFTASISRIETIQRIITSVLFTLLPLEKIKRRFKR